MKGMQARVVDPSTGAVLPQGAGPEGSAGNGAVPPASAGEVETPCFMPVGTKATVKALAPRELTELGARIVLANTYHLHERPGERLVACSNPILAERRGRKREELLQATEAQFQRIAQEVARLGHRLQPFRRHAVDQRVAQPGLAKHGGHGGGVAGELKRAACHLPGQSHQRVEQGGLAGAHAPEDRQVQVAVLDLVEHRLHRIVVVNQGLTYTGGKTRVVHKLTQAFARETQVIAALRLIVSASFLPGPSWQCGERPLPDAH